MQPCSCEEKWVVRKRKKLAESKKQVVAQTSQAPLQVRFGTGKEASRQPGPLETAESHARCLQNLASSLICMCHPTGGLAEGWVIQPNSLSASRRPGSTCCRETITPIGDVLGSGSGSRALKINIIAEDNPVRKASCRQGSETGQLRWK